MTASRMVRAIVVLTTTGVLSSLCVPSLARAEDDHTATSAALSTSEQKESYAVGMSVGRQVTTRGMKVDVEYVIRGLKDSLAGQTLLSDKEAADVIRELRQEERAEAGQRREESIRKNRQAGEAFLTANEKQPGVVTLPSGVQYKILKSATGKTPTPQDVIVCNYRASLIDGTEFDSSYKRGKPASFAMRRVMRGWREVVPLMPVGSKWQIVVPSKLGYGAMGAGNAVPPNSTLVFELELLGIKGAVDGGKATVADSEPSGLVEQQAALMDLTAKATAPAFKELRILFKQDSRLSGPTYGGDRWTAASPFTTTPQAGKEATVEARAEGIAASGAPAHTNAQWKPGNPQLVSVTNGEHDEVTITVHAPGESRLLVAANGASKELIIRGVSTANGMQVEITR